MDRTRLLKPLVYLMFVIFIAYLLDQKFYWDYSIWYFDMPMHFLGGLWEGWLFLWFFSLQEMPFLKISLDKIDLRLAIKTILFVLFVGVLWEIFEFFTHNYAPSNSFDILDTISDVFFDLAGGSFAVLYCLKYIMPKSESAIQ